MSKVCDFCETAGICQGCRDIINEHKQRGDKEGLIKTLAAYKVDRLIEIKPPPILKLGASDRRFGSTKTVAEGFKEAMIRGAEQGLQREFHGIKLLPGGKVELEPTR